jgi:hypothetical protein
MNISRTSLVVLALVTLIGCDSLLINLAPTADDKQTTTQPTTQPAGGGDNGLYILTLETFGKGKILVDQAGTSFKCDTKLRLSAVPDDGWVFDRWGGDAEGCDPVVKVTMNRDKYVSATFVPLAPDLVELSVLSVGHGAVFLTPEGAARENGVLYPRGTTVTLEADPDPYWIFLGYFTAEGRLLSGEEVTDFVLNTGTSIIAKFGELVPPPPCPILGEEVFADDGQYLGLISDDPFDPESLANPYGWYGDIFSSTCVWNVFSIYGREYSDLSAYDPFAEAPPGVYLGRDFRGYLTKNPYFQPQFDPDDVAAAIGRYDVIRD